MTNTEIAVQNIDGLIAQSRLTRPEHVALSENLKHLQVRALLLDTQEQEAKDAAREKIEEIEEIDEETDNAEPTGRIENS